MEAAIADALLLINEAVHASRTATLDAHRADIDSEHALAVRIGFGGGDELADGRWEEAIEIPHGERRRRAEVLRPQERIAAVLGAREHVAACELLLLRARADVDAARTREAALQVRVGLEALLAERSAFATSGQQEDLAALDERRRLTGEAANEALLGELSDAAGRRGGRDAEAVRAGVEAQAGSGVGRGVAATRRPAETGSGRVLSVRACGSAACGDPGPTVGLRSPQDALRLEPSSGDPVPTVGTRSPQDARRPGLRVTARTPPPH